MVHVRGTPPQSSELVIGIENKNTETDIPMTPLPLREFLHTIAGIGESPATDVWMG